MASHERPVVGLAEQADGHGGFLVPEAYRRYLERAGAYVVGIDPRSFDGSALDGLDGLCVPGGNDIDPALYGSLRTPDTDEPVPERDAAEPALVREAAGRGMPYLGICRGAQVLAVAFGGALAPCDGHRGDVIDEAVGHAVTAPACGALALACGHTSLRVNSVHHMAIAEPGLGNRVVAVADDGVVETITRPSVSFCLGVQWHPELMGDDASERLASAFVEACRRYRTMRS